MSRMVVACLAIVGLGWFCDAHAEDGSARIGLDVDLIQVDNEFLKDFGCGTPPVSNVLVLNDIEAFFIHQLVRENNTDKGIYQRPKASFTNGERIKVSNGQFSDERKLRITKKQAWPHTSPISFELTPRISPNRAVFLTFKYSIDGHMRSRVTRPLADGNSVLVLLDSPSEGTFTAAMVTPRIVE